MKINLIKICINIIHDKEETNFSRISVYLYVNETNVYDKKTRKINSVICVNQVNCKDCILQINNLFIPQL